MKQTILFCILTLLFTINVFSQTPICYTVNVDNHHHHELHISIEFSELPQQILKLRMPKASPGRYAAHNFAKNVYGEKAFNSKGEALTIIRATPEEWHIAGHDGYLRFEYTLFANHADGTYSGVDNRKLHLNMPATFIYGLNMEEKPIELSFNLGKRKWKVASQLKPLSETKFWAPNYYYFYDSPTMVGDIDFRRWESSSNGKTYTIEIAAIHEGTDKELDDYAAWVKQIVEEQKAVYGGLPDFDFDRYTFLVSYNPWVVGDGMEHRNSTICTSTGNLEENAKRLIGTISHEFFHAWNVERIRPKSLEPFEFDHANMSGELWFAEGFTSYYDDLILCRTGIISLEDYAKGLGNNLNYVLNFPGRMYRNPIEMSYHAPFTDDASAIDEHNKSNTFISYYSYGAAIGLALDLSIRAEFAGKTLDDVMAYLWEHYGKTEIPYEIPDLQLALAKVTGDADFAQSFFDQYIYDSKLPDYENLLSDFGLQLAYAKPDTAGFFDGKFRKTDEGFQLAMPTLKGMPIYEAGLNRGDKIVSIAGKKPESVKELNQLIASFKIGKQYPIVFIQNGIEVKSQIMAKQNPKLVGSLKEACSPETIKRRNHWLKQVASPSGGTK